VSKKRKQSASARQPGAGQLRIVPLGGLGEVGKNMMLFEYEAGGHLDSIIVDAGIMFPENDMLGIDYIIPDFQYILDKADTIRGLIVTHGHEDHTGAIAHLMEVANAPVYATPLTRGLLEVKLRRAGLLDRVTLHTMRAGDTIQLGPFTVETFHVCHSIPDSVGLGITTPVGLVVHSGDFKFDHTPVDGWPPDFAKLSEFAGRGVLALLSDSTNADRPGWTPSERVIDEAFDDVFRNAPGRIIVATFASLISRVQQVASAARRYGRVMALAGTSMIENVRMARDLGYLELPDDLLVDLEMASRLPPEQVVVMATGSQGEPSAVMGRLATGSHSQLEIEPGDTVVMSAHAIPGNEELVHRIINRLFQRGANVLYDPIAPVHVSGHASQEEMKLLINLVRPRFFIPIHGELRHLKQHASLAMELGIPPENVAAVENGTVLIFDERGMTVGERVPGGYVFVDGSGVGDIGPVVMRDRETLARDGFVVALVTVDRKTRRMVGTPQIISRGFVYMRDSEELIAAAQGNLVHALSKNGDRKSARAISDEVESVLSRFLYGETKRRPMVLAFVNEV
jgi:ribonuclease J